MSDKYGTCSLCGGQFLVSEMGYWFDVPVGDEMIPYFECQKCELEGYREEDYD